jgi:hypothetical protein
MKKFKDSNGREWSVVLNLAAAKKLKDEIEVDLLDGGESMQRLASDPYTMVNALWLLCEKQATAASITDEQFGESLAGDPIDEATTALLEEVVDFFPQGRRKAMKPMLTKLMQVQSQAIALATKKLESQEMENLIQKAMNETEAHLDALLTGSSSGSAQASSA